MKCTMHMRGDSRSNYNQQYPLPVSYISFLVQEANNTTLFGIKLHEECTLILLIDDDIPTLARGI